MQNKIYNTHAVLWLALGLLAMAATTQAAGQRGSMDPMEVFEHADANHDGNITRAEYVAARAAKFDELDRNHDGFLTDADFPRLKKMGGDRAQKFQTMLQKLDTDHDGKVSRDEFVNGGGAMFDMADANHDGVVDQAELQQAGERMKSLREH
jgi:Ca2+-binding EF-hand superfamily protein